MFTLPRHRRDTDRGMTLVEVLVAIGLLAIVGTIISGIVIAGLKLTRSTSSGVEGQSELNDAMSRITRDIAAADPILYTRDDGLPGGWGNSPSADELWTQAVTNDRCVRTRYYVATVGTRQQLRSATQTWPAAASGTTPECVDPRVDYATPAPVVKTLVKDLKTTNDAGAAAPVFTYYAKNNVVMTNPSRADVNKIARVKIDIGSKVRERDKGVRLVTSVAPRSMDNPLITNVPPPDCVQANPRVVSNGADPSAPVISWSATDFADLFILDRVSPSPATVVTTPNNPHTVTDTAMRGWWGTATPGGIRYQLIIEGPGGTSTCPLATYTVVNPQAINAPNITVSVTPDTSGGPADVPASNINISWPAVPRATEYQVYRQSIDPNGTHAVTGTWTAVGAPTTSTSFTQAPGFDTAYKWKVIARSTNYTPALTSGDSNTSDAVHHTNALTLSGSPLTYRQNRITWARTASTTADGYALWRRPAGTTSWGSAPLWSTTSLTTTTYDDTTAPLGSLYDYMMTVYNNGPRGTSQTGEVRYYGAPSNVVQILQYPETPVVTATGTEPVSGTSSFSAASFSASSVSQENPDGQYTATWLPVATATRYDLWETDTLGGADSSPENVGNTTRYIDTASNPRGTRNFYMAVAWNATGPSENHANSSLRAAVSDVAYQRPANITPTAGNAVADGCPDVAESATNLVYSCATGEAKAGFTPNADAGEPSDKFCAASGNPAQCKYVPVVAGSAQPTTVSGAPASPASVGIKQTNWGVTNPVAVLACNAGGCSDASTVDVRAYPGPFNRAPGNMIAERNHDHWWEGGNENDGERTEGQLKIDWSPSTGVRGTQPYKVTRTVVAHDPESATFTIWAETPTTDHRRSTPSAAYRYKIEAYAANGLSREVSFTHQMVPAKTTFKQSTKFCNSDRQQVDTKKTTTEQCKDVQVTKQRQVTKTRWVNCSPNTANTNPNPGTCVNNGGTPHWQKRTGPWVECGSVHASSNPDPGVCQNRSQNYHWRKKNSSGNWVDCNPAYGSTNPGGCTNRVSQDPYHWEKRSWEDCNQSNPGSDCVNNGGTPDWEKKEEYQETEYYQEWERQCEQVETTEPVYANINTWGWKAGYKFRQGAISNEGRWTYVNRFDLIEYAGRLGANNYDNGGNWIQKMLPKVGVADKEWLTKKPQNWDVGDEMWNNGTTGAGNDMSGERTMATTWGETMELVSNLTGSGQGVLSRTQVDRTGSHATDYGDWTGAWISVVEYKGSDREFTCSTGGWKPLPEWISRWAHVRSAAHSRPGSTQSDWNQNG